MRKLSLREVQLCELSLLQKVDKFCEEHEIVYFLGCGTLLGAIRHNGFIPWDDDADLFMPRPDYDRFIALREKFSLEFPDTAVKTLNDENYPIPFTKVFDLNTSVIIPDQKKVFNHIWVDIFPLDGAYTSEKINKLFFTKMHFYRFFMYWAYQVPFQVGQTKFKKIVTYIKVHISELFAKIFNPSNILDKTARKIPYEDSEFIGHTVCGDSIRNIIPKAGVYPILKKEFEGCFFNIPSNYDLYLKQVYGNYMELPPESKRINHSVAAWADVK